METENSRQKVICPLCSFEFEADGNMSGCNCPMASGSCDFICCPRCHYKLPAEPKSLKFLKKLFKYKER